VLRAANSSRFANAARLASVDQAVMRIGSGLLVALALGPALRGAGRASADARVEEEAWRHAAATALAADALRARVATPILPEAFSAALLHDLGRLVLWRHLDARLRGLLARAECEGRVSRCTAERELLGVEHPEVGALVAARWSLPPVIVDAIRMHHDPDAYEGDHGRTVDVVAVADAIARMAGIDGREGDPASEPTSGARARLGLSELAMKELADELPGRVEAMIAALA
jgi:HD-like signal output (HDOD) protein